MANSRIRATATGRVAPLAANVPTSWRLFSGSVADERCRSAPAEEVHFSKLNAIVPQDVISRRGVEE